VRMIFVFPVDATFSTAFFISAGETNCGFLYVNDAAGFSCGDEKIGLARKERGNLQDVATSAADAASEGS